MQRNPDQEWHRDCDLALDCPELSPLRKKISHHFRPSASKTLNLFELECMAYHEHQLELGSRSLIVPELHGCSMAAVKVDSLGRHIARRLAPAKRIRRSLDNQIPDAEITRARERE